eukprot:11993059-Alexandrium_andersonii.AAC.1
MQSCDTPLLLSLAAQEALGANLRMRTLEMELEELGVVVPLYKARGHLAVRVDGWASGEQGPQRVLPEEPDRNSRVVSQNSDVMVYLAQVCRAAGESEPDEHVEELEEPSHAMLSRDRGVSREDPRGILTKAVRK